MAQKAFEAGDHDFRQYAGWIVVNYGPYDILANMGFMFVGINHDDILI